MSRFFGNNSSDSSSDSPSESASSDQYPLFTAAAKLLACAFSSYPGLSTHFTVRPDRRVVVSIEAILWSKQLKQRTGPFCFRISERSIILLFSTTQKIDPPTSYRSRTTEMALPRAPCSSLVHHLGYSNAVLLCEAGAGAEPHVPPLPWVGYRAEQFPPWSTVAIWDGCVRGCGVLMPERTPDGDVRIWGESRMVVVDQEWDQLHAQNI